MILIFTYHKISPDAQGRGGEFYTITRTDLRRQFEALARTGRCCLEAASLRATSQLPANNFLLSFDDGTLDHFDFVMPLLKEFAWRAIFFVPTAKLGRPGHMVGEQIRELARAGHAIGFHSHEHRRLDLAKDDQMREQIGRSQQIVAELLGEQPWLFAPPGGFMNEHVREVALGFGVEAIRTMRWGYNARVDLTSLETIPINRYTNDVKFQQLLEFRQPHYLYVGKQAMKTFVPTRAYEKLRNLLFGFTRRN